MKNTYIIGIAGGSASGKSTIAEKLRESLKPQKTVLFAMDSYYKPEIELPLVTTANGKQYRDYNCPDSFKLENLYSDIEAAKKSQEIIIIEGLLTLYDDKICDLLDLRIFVDCPADIRIVRRIKRNLSWGLSFEEITDVYIDLVRYRHQEFVEPSKNKADLIINSLTDINDSIKNILANIK